MLSPVILGAKKLPSTCCIKNTPIAANNPFVTDPVIAQVYFTSDFNLTASAFEPTQQLQVDAAGLFADPANHDFTLMDKDIEAGDPRWYQ